jgi:hypothetical protein
MTENTIRKFKWFWAWQDVQRGSLAHANVAGRVALGVAGNSRFLHFTVVVNLPIMSTGWEFLTETKD